MVIQFLQQHFGVFNSMAIDEIEETDPKPGIDDLGQMVNGTSDRLRKLWQRQAGAQVNLFVAHEPPQGVLVRPDLFFGKTRLRVFDPAVHAGAIRHDRSALLRHRFVIIDDQKGRVFLQGDEFRALVQVVIAAARAGRDHPVLEGSRVTVRQHVTEQLVAMTKTLEEAVKTGNQFVVRALRVFGNIAINTVGSEVIGNSLGIVMIPRVEIAFNELGRAHK